MLTNKLTLVHATTSLLFARKDQCPTQVKSLGQLVDDGFMPLTGEAREGFSAFNGVSQDRISCFKVFANSSWDFYMNMIYQRGHSGNINLKFYLQELDDVLNNIKVKKINTNSDNPATLSLWEAQYILIWGLRVAELSSEEFQKRKNLIQHLGPPLAKTIEMEKDLLDRYRLVATDNSKYQNADHIAQYLTGLNKAQPFNSFPIDAPGFDETQEWFNHFKGNLHYRFDYWFPHYLEGNFTQFQNNEYQQKFLKKIDKYKNQLDVFYGRFISFLERDTIEPIYQDVDFSQVYPILLVGEFNPNDPKHKIIHGDNNGEAYIKGPIDLGPQGFSTILCHPDYRTQLESIVKSIKIPIQIGDHKDYLDLLEKMTLQHLQYLSKLKSWDQEKFESEYQEIKENFKTYISSPEKLVDLYDGWFKAIEVRT